MEFRLLGPIEVRQDDEPIPLGGSKQRALLAMLLLHANEVVSSDRLVDGLWGAAPPPSAAKSLQVHVSGLRKVLEPARTRGESGHVLKTQPPGYVIELDPEQLDRERFIRLAEAGRAALAAGDPETAASNLTEALVLWRGQPLADVAYAEFAQDEIGRLEELHRAAMEDRIQADLERGRAAEVVGELEQLIAEEPLRENPRRQLMLALYRSGRQAEALEVYREARSALVDELGIEPSKALQDLHEAILRHDPSLDVPVITRREDGGATRVPIIGRRSERAELSEALAGARAGTGRLFLIAGDAGIGKTRLAEALAEEASDGGDTVLWGSGWEAGGAPAYWPWTQVIRELLRRRPAGEVADDLDWGAPYLAQIAPELGRRLNTDQPPPPLDSEAARFTAFDATASFLRAAAVRRPIVVVLDDLHAADVASVRLLEFVARGLHGARILAVGTYRTGAARPGTDVAAALADLGNVGRRLVLGGMSRDEVSELAAERSPKPPVAQLVDRLHQLTEGNPLFVDEVMRLLAAEGGALDSARLPVPEGVRDTIRRRLDPLDRAAMSGLTAAAVIGQEFALATLARVLGEEPTDLLGSLDEAAEAGLVEELPGALGRYRFAHALVRETLYDDLSGQERVNLHVAVGEALVAMHGDRPDPPLAEIAHHFVQAAPAGDPARAADYAARAAERALESMAYEQAIDLFGDALRALDLAPGGPERRGAILLAMGQAEMRAGRLHAGRATLRKAADVARRTGYADLLALAALASAPWGLATALRDEESLTPLLEEALERLPPDDGALRARLLARLAATQYWAAPPERRHPLAQEAIDMARRVGDPATLAAVLSDAHLATWDPDSPERSLPWAGEIYALAERLGEMELAMAAHSWRISLLLELGELATVDAEIEKFAADAARLHQPRALAQSLIHRCARDLIAGNFDDAERLLGQAAEYAGLLQQDQILSMRLAGLAFVMREVQGRLGELEGAVHQFADAQPAMPAWRGALICVYLQTGRETELRREYERFAADGFASLPRDNLWLPALAFLAEACRHVGDKKGARELQSLLAPYSGRNVVTPDVAFIGPVDRYLALVAATAGDDRAAAAYFASARSLTEGMGAKPTLARIEIDESALLGERGPAEPPAKPRTATGRLARRGDVWEVAGSGAAFMLKDAKGLQYLAQLVASPGREFPALELAGAGTGASPQGDAGPRLDTHAKAEYRQRIVDLQEEIDEAEAFNDPERATRAREELDFISRELAGAVGLGGRDRATGAAAERARVSVTRALRAAVDRIGEHDATLGHHLRTCIRTGTFCSYDPGPDARAWDL